ncbi:MAG TPA: carbohydrate-binding family 9-like protein, partial [Chitinophagaceae bacterium]|nr:carbohydrate-binding family 9-like protein [Chitinophagaceae bacterium]
MYKSLVILLVLHNYCVSVFAQTANKMLHIKHANDFVITGDGSNTNWQAAEWNIITQRNKKILAQNNWDVSLLPDNDIHYKTEFKILYSDSGIYCLFRCEDSIVTATHKADFTELYNEDVVEVFLQPDTTAPVYFEY